MITLTAEQRQEIKKAGDEPIRIEDPETHATYVLLRAEVYDGLKPPPPAECEDQLNLEIPEGIRRAKEAFLRDLPELMARKRLRGRWVLYHLEKRVGIWRNPRRMERKIMKLGLRSDDYYAGVIEPHSDEDAEIETSLFEYDEIPPELEAELSRLNDSDDEDVRRAARSRLDVESARRLDSLHRKLRGRGLTQEESRTLLDLYERDERATLIRAHAAAIWKGRGHDPSDLIHEDP
jgi:hypothetical protein